MYAREGISRRDFLRVAAGTAVVAGASGALGTRAAGAAGRVPRGRIGIQLYSLRDQMQSDFEGTLAAVAEIGYAEVEFAGLYGRTPEQVRQTIDGLGLRAPSSHVGVSQMNSDPEGVFGAARTLGQTWVIEPYFRSDTLDGYRQLAEDLNRAGEAAKEYGLRVGYHNHAHEFERMGRMSPYSVIIKETDPSLVDLELDLYWAIEGYHTYANERARPLALFDQAPGRFALFHVKDGFPRRPGVQFADVGEGVISFGPIFAAKQQAGVQHFITERDDAPSDPNGSLDSAEDMYDNLVAEYGR